MQQWENWQMTAQEEDDTYLGQFIPLQYHFAMLEDKNRMRSFKAAIDYVVAPGSKVLELGGGTGILSWFAAAKAEKVWCIEFNPGLVNASRQILENNHNGHKVEVVLANAFDYLPPEPVDVMICEMIHVAMLREKQVEMVESFKRRYQQRFGATLPLLMPTAIILAVQPLQQEFIFEGYYAPISMIQDFGNLEGCIELAEPSVYRILDFTQHTERDISWDGFFKITEAGTVSALRFITKNILAILEEKSTIDWLIRYMALPLATPGQSADW
jgi:predicted RNA methylase